MFDSNIKADKFIEDLQLEIDVALDIPKESYMEWLNSLEQMLYSEVIKEQKEHVTKLENNTLMLSEYLTGENEDALRFEDIYAVYVGEKQLIKSTVASGTIFKDCYYKHENNLKVNVSDIADSGEVETRIIYHVRPQIKSVTAGGSVTGNVMLPVEFIDLAKAKLRGEAYKLANEDSIAAKWINDYNILLETFKAWVEGKKPMFGL